MSRRTGMRYGQSRRYRRHVSGCLVPLVLYAGWALLTVAFVTARVCEWIEELSR